MSTPDEAADWRRLPSWLLTQTGAHAHRLVFEGFTEVGARGYHFRILATLDEFGPASQADLSRRSGIHFSDMVAAVTELAEADLVRREPDPGDRRRNIISATPAGRRQLGRLRAQLAATQETLLAPLDDSEREQLTTLLTRLLDHHDARP